MAGARFGGLKLLKFSTGTQVTRIYEKLEVRNRLDLLTLAIERGWVEDSRSHKAAR